MLLVCLRSNKKSLLLVCLQIFSINRLIISSADFDIHSVIQKHYQLVSEYYTNYRYLEVT